MPRLLVRLAAAVEPAQKPLPRLRRLLAALLLVRIPFGAAVPVAPVSVDDAAEGAVERPAAALVAPLDVVLPHAGEHHLVEAVEVARDEADDDEKVVRGVPQVAVVRGVSVVEDAQPVFHRLVVTARAPEVPRLRIERVRHEDMPLVRLVGHELVDRAAALLLLPEREVAGGDAVLGRDHDPPDVGVQFDELAVELERLVGVVRALAGIGLHEERVRDQRLVEVLRLRLYLHLAPFRGGGAVARNEVRDAHSLPLRVVRLREYLGGAVDACAA